MTLELGALQILIGVVGMVIVTLGPGGGIYWWLRKSVNGAVKDITDMKERQQDIWRKLNDDHDLLLPLVQEVERHTEEIKSLRRTKHSHANTLTALTLRTSILEEKRD